MKLKKFFAGVLAAAMMLTVGATAAFADTPSSIKSFGEESIGADGSWTIGKHYIVAKGTAPAETFEFNVKYDSSKNKDSQAGEPGAVTGMPKKIEYANKMDVNNNAYDGTFKISPSELGLGSPNGTGTYIYEITETNKGTPGVDYDERTVYLVVTVAHATNADKSIIPNQWVYYAALHRDSATGTKIQGTDAFTNIYGKKRDPENPDQPGDTDTVFDLIISKNIAGSMADLGEKFDFDISLTGAEGKTYAGAKVEQSSDSTVTANTVWNISSTGNKVTLGRDESIKLSNIPADVSVSVTEGNSAVVDGKVMNGQYTVTVDSTAENAIGSFEGTVIKGTMPAKNAKIAITNTHEGVPDMGVVLDNAPYIAMLAIVAIGGVALMLNKRRRDEE